MSLKEKIKSAISPAFLWRLGATASLLIILGCAAILWFTGSSETKDAFSDGRRVLIRFDDGTIIGKQAVLEKSEPEKPQDKSDATGEKPASEGAPEGPTTKLEGPAAGTVTSDNTNAELAKDVSQDLGASAAAAPAKVPLAGLNPALSEKTDSGSIPKIASDGTRAWKYYAKPFERKGSAPVIAIVVSGLGGGRGVTENAMKLPENVTLSFSPYSKNIESWTKAARTTGHEIMLDLPMEPANYPVTDPGPYGLLVGKTPEENDKRLEWIMARMGGYIGFLTPQGESYSSNNDAFKSLLTTLSTRGLMLVVGHEPAKTETKQMLETGNTPAVIGDVLIDEELSPTAIQARLTTLEQIAKNRGYAVGVAQAYPVSMEQINLWSAKLEAEGFVLVPLSFIVKLHYS